MNIIQNKVFTYLRKNGTSGGNPIYELHYIIELDNNKHTLDWKPIAGLTFNRISDSLLEITGFEDLKPPKTKVENVLTLIVEKSSGQDVTSQIGIVKIIGIKDRAKWDKIKLTMQLKDPSGGPIGGNGSTTHYGDGDG